MAQCPVAIPDSREQCIRLAEAHFGEIWPIVQFMAPSTEEAALLFEDALVRGAGSYHGNNGQSDFKVWLLNRVCRTHAEHDGVATELPDPSAHGAADDSPAALTDALWSLPLTLRMPVVLCDVGGLSYRDIAHILDLPVGAVRSRVHRARQQLLESGAPTIPSTRDATSSGNSHVNQPDPRHVGN